MTTNKISIFLNFLLNRSKSKFLFKNSLICYLNKILIRRNKSKVCIRKLHNNSTRIVITCNQFLFLCLIITSCKNLCIIREKELGTYFKFLNNLFKCLYLWLQFLILKNIRFNILCIGIKFIRTTFKKIVCTKKILMQLCFIACIK